MFKTSWPTCSAAASSWPPGIPMQIGAASYMKLREPQEAEYYLQGPGPVLAVEIIDSSQINPPEADTWH